MLDAHAMNVCTGEANNKLLLLSSLRKQNLVEFVVQVGHDGVLQMAGFPPDQVANDSTAAGHVTTELTSDWLQVLEVYSTEQLAAGAGQQAASRALDNADLVVVAVDNMVAGHAASDWLAQVTNHSTAAGHVTAELTSDWPRTPSPVSWTGSTAAPEQGSGEH